MLMIFGVIIAVLFFLEVVLGSCTGVYNAEIGSSADFENVSKISPKEFVFGLLPLGALSAAIPLILFLIF